MENNRGCTGYHCPVKKQCKRFTKMKPQIMSKCRNQTLFIQDEDAVNTDSKRR